MWSKAALIGWVVILGVLIGYEIWCALGGNPRNPALTDVTVRYLPWWIIMPFLTWLWLHFLLHYFTKLPEVPGLY